MKPFGESVIDIVRIHDESDPVWERRISAFVGFRELESEEDGGSRTEGDRYEPNTSQILTNPGMTSKRVSKGSEWNF